MRRSISRPMRWPQRQEDQSGFISTSTTQNDLTPALTAYPLISSTITTCRHYPWQPETMQESTYKSGLAVQTTRATSGSGFRRNNFPTWLKICDLSRNLRWRVVMICQSINFHHTPAASYLRRSTKEEKCIWMRTIFGVCPSTVEWLKHTHTVSIYRVDKYLPLRWLGPYYFTYFCFSRAQGDFCWWQSMSGMVTKLPDEKNTDYL